ncbi:uncharacterized protein LOC129316786 [Prosopis cineraria]|uniref:uncharacterized protein LOC129316786 n=1 Tax=Prosopis cineraria TaxID=364024 RepID=UPI00240FF24E|nr:uncharacterized protein LOC129316786 [Prosopis cineraria]
MRMSVYIYLNPILKDLEQQIPRVESKTVIVLRRELNNGKIDRGGGRVAETACWEAESMKTLERRGVLLVTLIRREGELHRQRASPLFGDPEGARRKRERKAPFVHKITHSDSQFPETPCLDDQNSNLFAWFHQNPQGYSVSSPQTVDSVAATACHRGLKRNKLNPELSTDEEKLLVLVKSLKPIPFIPSEALDFKSRESLLRRLGLWDFVHVEFDTSIRSGLLAQLMANYTPNLRGGYVNGIKIMVNRED